MTTFETSPAIAAANEKTALDNFEAFRAYIRFNPNDKSPPTPGELLRAKELASEVCKEQSKFSRVNSLIDDKRDRDARDMISAGLEDLMIPDTTLQIRSVLEHLLVSLDSKGRLPKDAFEGFDLSVKAGTKQAINIRLDTDIVMHFKRTADRTKAKYQTLINTVLRRYIDKASGRWDAKGERRIVGLIISLFHKGGVLDGRIAGKAAVEDLIQRVFTSPLLFNISKEKAENLTRLMVKHSEGHYILFADHFEHYINQANPEEVLKGVLMAVGFKVEELLKEDYLDWSFKKRQSKPVVLSGAVHNHYLAEERIDQELAQTAEALDTELADTQPMQNALGVRVSLAHRRDCDGYNMANVRHQLGLALTRLFCWERNAENIHPDVVKFMEAVNMETGFEWELILFYDAIAASFYDVTGNRGRFIQQLNEQGFYVGEFTQEDFDSWTAYLAKRDQEQTEKA